MDRFLSGLKDYIAHLKLFSSNARAFLLGSLIIWIGASMFMLLLNLYFKELGFSESYIGTVLSRTALGSVLFAVPVGLILGRFTFRFVLTLSAVIIAVGYVVQVVTESSHTILVAAFVAGIGFTVFRSASAPFFMRHTTEKERTYLFSMNFAVSTFGALAGSLIGGYLPRLFSLVTDIGYEQHRYALVVASLIIVASSIPFLSIREETPDRKATSQFLKNLKGTNWKLIGKLSVPAFIIGTGAGLIIPFMNLYFKDLFDSSADTIGILFALLQCFMTAGTLMGPVLGRKMGLVRSVVASQIASIPFMLVLCFSRYFPVVVVSFLLRGALMNMNQPLSANFAMESVRKEEHAVTNSMLMLAWMGSWAISVQIGGVLIEHYSYVPSFLAAISLYVVASVLYYLFFKDAEAARLLRHQIEVKEV
ncbi:MAG: MFS transporter [Candidatus Eiseniibacteriota bacterium]|nr:MAG: MFS transporter [Candidatus Eisenbacteria bacterium]